MPETPFDAASGLTEFEARLYAHLAESEERHRAGARAPEDPVAVLNIASGSGGELMRSLEALGAYRAAALKHDLVASSLAGLDAETADAPDVRLAELLRGIDTALADLADADDELDAFRLAARVDHLAAAHAHLTPTVELKRLEPRLAQASPAAEQRDRLLAVIDEVRDAVRGATLTDEDFAGARFQPLGVALVHLDRVAATIRAALGDES